jgi:quinoprotein glucose dehydrogenase
VGLGKLGHKESFGAIVALLREPTDPFLRHGVVLGLAGCGTPGDLGELSHDPAPAVRMGAVLALRRLRRLEIARFLQDSDADVAFEAIRAVHDEPIPEALLAVAALTNASEKTAARIINANFRLGTPEAAARLLHLAQDAQQPVARRVAALQALGAWEQEVKFDRVLYLWRPLSPRGTAAADTLRSSLSDLVKQGPREVASAATAAAARLRLPEAVAELFGIVNNPAVPAPLRAEALQMLAEQTDARVAEALRAALDSSDEAVRRVGARWIARAELPDPIERLQRIIRTDSSIRVRQAAIAALGKTPDSHAGEALRSLLLAAAARELPPEVYLDLLDAVENRADKIAGRAAQQLRDTRPAGEPLAPWWEALQGGDAAVGRKIFMEHPGAACLRCHKIDGVGGVVGPDLSNVGTGHSRRYLLEAIVAPNAVIAEGYEQAVLHLDNGQVVTGRVAGEDATTVELILADGQHRRIARKTIEERTRAASAMPEALARSLKPREIRDLVEFLVEQRGPAR